MKLSEGQRKLLLILMLISFGLFGLELFAVKYEYFPLDGINQSKLGLFLLPPIIGTIFTLCLAYDNLFNKENSGTLTRITKTWFLVLVSGILIMGAIFCIIFTF